MGVQRVRDAMGQGTHEEAGSGSEEHARDELGEVLGTRGETLELFGRGRGWGLLALLEPHKHHDHDSGQQEGRRDPAEQHKHDAADRERAVVASREESVDQRRRDGERREGVRLDERPGTS